MKISSLLIIVSFLLCGLKSDCQNKMGYRVPTNAKSVPASVTTAFNKKNPDILLHGWYATHASYWAHDFSSDWYSDWYGQRTIEVYTYEKPTYYEVEFTDYPGEVSRSLYNLYGVWFQTRTQIKAFPFDVKEALKTSQYETWKISALKERIEAQGWPTSIYRFYVSKGLKSAIIRMDEKGQIIQVKNLENDEEEE
jgi:hypothetical protein